MTVPVDQLAEIERYLRKAKEGDEADTVFYLVEAIRGVAAIVAALSPEPAEGAAGERPA